VLCQFVREKRFLLVLFILFVKLVFFDGFLETCSHVDDFCEADARHGLHKSLGSRYCRRIHVK
jgi:hypothetical protein